MKTKIVLRNQNLWERIQRFSLDAENSAFPFSKKLAKEENWTLDFTQKAIEEYKKFVYLCCISPNGASPSEIVDKVWHMHLIYTQSYWEDFCPNILKQNLHHHPSTGGNSEKSKHENWFAETLENYREIFNQEPPEEIWKCNRQKAKNTWFNGLKFFSIIAVLLLLNSCSDAASSVFWTLFIVLGASFFILFIIGTILPTVEIKRNNKNENNSSNNSSDGGSSCSSGSSCSGGSSCGSSCGGGCGGCGS